MQRISKSSRSNGNAVLRKSPSPQPSFDFEYLSTLSHSNCGWLSLPLSYTEHQLYRQDINFWVGGWKLQIIAFRAYTHRVWIHSGCPSLNGGAVVVGAQFRVPLFLDYLRGIHPLAGCGLNFGWNMHFREPTIFIELYWKSDSLKTPTLYLSGVINTLNLKKTHIECEQTFSHPWRPRSFAQQYIYEQTSVLSVCSKQCRDAE